MAGLADVDSARAARRTTMDSLRVVGVDPEYGFGGGETQVLGLSLEIERLGHHADLVCDPGGLLWQRARAAGIECHPLRIRNALDVAAGLRLRRLLARGAYDVVHFHTSRAHAMAPYVRNAAPVRVVTRRMDYRPHRISTVLLYNRSVDGVAAISGAVADALREAGVAPQQITVIPSGVDCARLHPPSESERSAARGRLGLAAGELAVGSVGSLEARKGHRYLIEAIAAIARTEGGPRPRVRCFIAGEGPLRRDLEAMVAAAGLGGRVRLLGRIADSRSLLHALDIFVFPSLREGLGVALLEAMACGLSVIASRAGALAEVVEHECHGLLVPAADSGAIAEAISHLADSPSARAAMGRAARQRVVARFTMAQMAGRTLALYRHLLEA